MERGRTPGPDEGWLDYLSDMEKAEGFIPFFFQYCGYNYEFVNWLRSRVEPGGKILEVGCGSGVMSIILSSFGYRVTALDIDPRLVDRGRAKAAWLGAKVDFLTGDMFKLGEKFPAHEFDLAFSYGVIEHYEYPTASLALASQGSVARRVLAVVPSRLVDTGLRGDERPYTLSRLRSVVRRAGLEIEDGYAFGLSRSGQKLRAWLPYSVWYHLIRPALSSTLAVIGRTRLLD